MSIWVYYDLPLLGLTFDEFANAMEPAFDNAKLADHVTFQLENGKQRVVDFRHPKDDWLDHTLVELVTCPSCGILFCDCPNKRGCGVTSNGGCGHVLCSQCFCGQNHYYPEDYDDDDEEADYELVCDVCGEHHPDGYPLAPHPCIVCWETLKKKLTTRSLRQAPQRGFYKQ